MNELRCYYRIMGGHVHCRVFGPTPMTGAGGLVFRVEEWSDVLALMDGRMTFINEDDDGTV